MLLSWQIYPIIVFIVCKFCIEKTKSKNYTFMHLYTAHISVSKKKNLFTYQLQIILFLFVNLRNWLIGIFKLNIYSKFEFPLYSAKNLEISIIFDYFIYLPYIKRKLSLNLVYDLQKKYDLSWFSISLLFPPFYFPLIFTYSVYSFFTLRFASHIIIVLFVAHDLFSKGKWAEIFR